jgi:hypothetical protein
MYAVISDIHGNFEALEAVLRDMPGEVDTVYCLGDVIGYGASPNECCDAVRSSGCPPSRATTTWPSRTSRPT